MKRGVINHPSVPQVLDDDPLEQRRSHSPIPDSFRINGHDWSSFANAQTRGFAPLHTPGAEQQPFPFEQFGQQRVQRPAPPFRGTKRPGADENVEAVGVQG